MSDPTDHTPPAPDATEDRPRARPRARRERTPVLAPLREWVADHFAERPAWALPAVVAIGVVLAALAVWWFAVVLPSQRLVDEASALYGQGRYEEASATLAPVLGRDSGHRGALLEMARLKAAMGDAAGALDLYQRYIETGGVANAVYVEIAQLERVVGRSRSAADHLREAWESDRGDLKLADELARTLVTVGQASDAAKIYLELADDESRPDPERKDLYIKAGIAFTEADAIDDARTAFNSALKLVPKDPQATMLLKRLK